MADKTSWIVPGALAEYAPVLGNGDDRWFPCVIRSEPWELGHGALVAKIGGQAPAEYTACTGRDTFVAGGVLVTHLRPRKEESNG
jgi:hypothetical protein